MIVIFGRSSHWISRLVRWRTKSQWSHVGIIQGDHVLEARGPVGVQLTPLFQFESRYSVTERRCLPGNEEKAKSKLGARFDVWGLWGIFFRKQLHHKDKWFCSELVAYASLYFRDDIAHHVTPEHLYWVSTKHPN